MAVGRRGLERLTALNGNGSSVGTFWNLSEILSVSLLVPVAAYFQQSHCNASAETARTNENCSKHIVAALP